MQPAGQPAGCFLHAIPHCEMSSFVYLKDVEAFLLSHSFRTAFATPALSFVQLIVSLPYLPVFLVRCHAKPNQPILLEGYMI